MFNRREREFHSQQIVTKWAMLLLAGRTWKANHEWSIINEHKIWTQKSWVSIYIQAHEWVSLYIYVGSIVYIYICMCMLMTKKYIYKMYKKNFNFKKRNGSQLKIIICKRIIIIINWSIVLNKTRTSTTWQNKKKLILDTFS